MMNKRKRDDTSAASANNRDPRAKKQRVPKRPRSEPLKNESVSAGKHEVLRRLFIRIAAADLEENHQPQAEDDDYISEEEERFLVEDVPAQLDPEALGFLVCAQETLRYLNSQGVGCQNPIFNSLRQLLLQGISEIGVA